jgi:hypothetical protein
MIEERAMLKNNESLRLYLRGASKPKAEKLIATSNLYNSATFKQIQMQAE